MIPISTLQHVYDHFDQIPDLPSYMKALSVSEESVNYESVCKEELEKLIRHPLLCHWHEKCKDSKRRHIGAFVRSPKDALGERLGICSNILFGEYDDILNNGTPFGLNVAGARIGLSSFVEHAPLYLIRDTVEPLARDFDVPRHIISSTIMPYGFMWITWEHQAFTLLKKPPFMSNAKLKLDTVLLQYAQDNFLQVYYFGAIDNRPTCVRGAGPIFGRRYPEDIDISMALVIKLLCFLNSKLVSIEKESLPKPLRKKLSSEVTDINVVTLRAYEQTHRSYNNDPDHVDWKYRWLVKGHNRAQWYPSEKAHHIIWVEPHLKGPEGKPLKDRIYDVKR